VPTTVDTGPKYSIGGINYNFKKKEYDSISPGPGQYKATL